MKIKSLLLGSAAAMVAVSGAQAADAIIVEPEPVEYVRVCDMYGAGYFYIPGTETCLRISGQVRIDYNSAHYHDTPDNYLSTAGVLTAGWDDTSHHSAVVRGRIGFTAQNETEYGTLGSDIVYTLWRTSLKDEFSATEGYHGQAGGLDGLTKATINLAGFRAGYDGVAGGAWMRYGGYGYYNARHDGFYYAGGTYSAMFFEYGGSVGDINYVVGVQDSMASGTPGAPDPYIGMTAAFGGLSLGAIVVYDSNGGYDEDDVTAANLTGSTSDGGFAYKIRADYDLSSMIPGGSIGGWWMADHGETDYVKGHAWGVTMQANLTDKLVAFGGYSAIDYDDVSSATAIFPGGAPSVADWTVGVRWNVASGLYVQAEWNKTIADDNIFLDRDLRTGAAQVDFTESSRDRFNLRILRSF